MPAQRGWSMPWLNILLVIIALLTWLYGWIVLLIVGVLFGLITLGVWIHDIVVHDEACRWCNVIKDGLAAERDIARERITTKHRKSYPTYMQVQVLIDGMPDARIDIDFNEQIHRVQEWPYPDREPLDI